MLVICTICLNGLDSPPEGPLNTERRICTIECGHIFHVTCLNHWWRSMMMQRVAGQPYRFPCPICRRIFDRPLVFQIFPSIQTSQSQEEESMDPRLSELSNLNDQLRLTLNALSRELEISQETLDRLKRRDDVTCKSCQEEQK